MSDPLPPDSTPNPAPSPGSQPPLTPPGVPAPGGPSAPPPAFSAPVPPAGVPPQPEPASPASAPTPPPAPIAAPAGAPAAAPAPGSAENQWAVGLHLSGLLGLLGCSIPALNIIGPLVIWLMKRPESARLDAVGKRVLNFQISFAIYMAACWIGFFGLGWILIGFLFMPLLFVVAVGWLVLTILGAVKESNGEAYRFPLTIEFLK